MQRCPPPGSGSGPCLPPAPPCEAPGAGAGPAGQDGFCYKEAGGQAATGMAQGGHQPGAIHDRPASSALPCVPPPAGPHAQPAAGGHGSQGAEAEPGRHGGSPPGGPGAGPGGLRAHQDSAGQQAETIAQTARLLAKAWLPCHKTKPDLLLALPRAELLLVSQALQAMLCSPIAAKQGSSQVLMAMADGSVGPAKSQALAALTPDSVWLVCWAQAMDVQQSAQAVNRSPDSQTASKEKAASMTLQLIPHDASSSEEKGEEVEGSSVPSLGADAAGGVERLYPPSALQVAHVALQTAITVAPLSLGLNLAWPKPLVTLLKDSLGVLAAQLEQGKVLDADMAAMEQYVRSVAQPLGGELPMSFMEAYVGRAMRDLGQAVMTLEFVIDLRLVLQARTLRQQITDLAQKLAGTSSLDAGGLHQLSALVTYLPLVKVQDEPSSPAWCWREVKLQLQLVVLQCLHGLTLPYTIVIGSPGEDGAVQAATLDLPTCLALCTCAAFVTSEPPAATASSLPGRHLTRATAPSSLPCTEVADQSGSLTLPRQLASEEAGGRDSSPLTQATHQHGILQLPLQVTMALTCALQQLRDSALTPHDMMHYDISVSTTAAAGSTGHSALNQQLQALGWAHALTLTLPASPAGASQEKHQAAIQDVPLGLPSSASCVAWPGPIPGKQLAAVLDLQQLAKLQAASNIDHQAELFQLHLRLARVCHAWYAGDDPPQPSGLQEPMPSRPVAQQVPPGPWCMQLAAACSQDSAFSASPQVCVDTFQVLGWDACASLFCIDTGETRRDTAPPGRALSCTDCMVWPACGYQQPWHIFTWSPHRII
ncbi:hypothetical protein HaLaN_16788, partial [Haematococcus lacustris]